MMMLFKTLLYFSFSQFRHASRQGRPLGQERKWLGHFDFAASALILSPSDIDYSSYLRKTLSDADDIFASVVSDQSSIAQAFKMVDTDSAMVASGDENLEHLRWYVTAKECASLLSRGITESPVASDIIGAIRPCSSYMPSVGETQVCEVAEMCNDDTLPTDVSDKDGSSFELTQLAEFNDRERKKANRDSSTWGQGISLHSSSKTQSEGLSVSEVLPVKQSNCRHRHVTPPAKLMRLVTNAVMQWEMIQEGDRLLLGLSGGKDSLTLLHCLLELKRKLRTKFEIEICTIDPMTPSFDPSPLIPYVESLGLKYHFIKDDIVARASTSGTGGSMVKSLCAFCARMKRGNLYACARKNNCNKLVLAQHLDDCAESFMMSVMHNGFLRTMKAHYQINAGDLSVIRPMVYCRESLMAEFAKMKALPVINENCPACFEEPKERARIKKLLSREETLYPNFYDNIRRSLLPLMHEDATSILRCYTEETLAKSRKDQKRERSPDTDDFRHVPKKRREDGGLGDIPDDDLVLELARRKAAKYHLAGAMKRNDNDATTDQSTEMGVDDPTSQLCSLKGGNGTIPCYELME
jgi:tRNA(Ile)-lysidine synthase TilS/MesJ